MSAFEDAADAPKGNRWYDRDPVLSRAMEQLRLAPDKHQAQIALNIIKIVVEHRIEEKTDEASEHLDKTLPYRSSLNDQGQHRRWYDVQETLSSAIQMLCDCPDDLQQRIIPSISYMIERTLLEIVE